MTDTCTLSKQGFIAAMEASVPILSEEEIALRKQRLESDKETMRDFLESKGIAINPESVGLHFCFLHNGVFVSVLVQTSKRHLIGSMHLPFRGEGMNSDTITDPEAGWKRWLAEALIRFACRLEFRIPLFNDDIIAGMARVLYMAEVVASSTSP